MPRCNHRPVRLYLTTGLVSDCKEADGLLAELPSETEEIIGDRGHDNNRIRIFLSNRNIIACIPLKRNRNSNQDH
ncbi:transposase [Gluconobacter wancherniae]|uniref:transposase n=1 Tax=Gluconobacter wancherniae TaxID=1307955 RepID=UPI001B8CC58E|nr:transposase [Gluconobacter wancherniae]